LCSSGYDGLQHAHLYDKALANKYNEWYKQNGRESYSRDIPNSLHATPNGLLLCPNCHEYFDTKETKTKAKKTDDRDNRVKITSDGTIEVAESTRRKDATIAKLHNKKVPWAALIGVRGWPSKELLTVVYDLKSGLPLPTSSSSSSSAAPQVARTTPLGQNAKSILKRTVSETSDTSQNSARRVVEFDTSATEDEGDVRSTKKPRKTQSDAEIFTGLLQASGMSQEKMSKYLESVKSFKQSTQKPRSDLWERMADVEGAQVWIHKETCQLYFKLKGG